VYLLAETPQNAVSGFQASGVWQYNPKTFSHTDYDSISDTVRSYSDCALVSVTDHPYADCHEKCGIGTGFLPVFQFSLVSILQPMFHTHAFIHYKCYILSETHNLIK
jgi:hypothetical protein